MDKLEALDILISGIDSEWQKLLVNPKLKEIIKILVQEEKIITPKLPQVFEFARLTSLKEVSVVIIGQDPYPTKDHAHGLAFSCKKGVPASLLNIYNCLVKHKIIKSSPMHGDLTSWASQGVLMINRALTTHEGRSNVHAKLWDTYTSDLVRAISDLRPLVFLLWGANARQLLPVINKKSFILTWGHPSPLNTTQAFIDCPHFAETNDILKRLGRSPINWASVEQPPMQPKRPGPSAQPGPPGPSGPQTQSETQQAQTTQQETKQSESDEMSEEEKMMSVVKNCSKTDCILFTDGACSDNGSPQARGSYAIIVRFADFTDQVIYERLNRPATNIVAEAMGIKNAFDFLQKHPTKWRTAYVNTDSEFWVKMFKTYMPNWAKKKMDFKEKANPDITIPLWAQYNEINKTHKVFLRWVPAHNKKQWMNKPENTYEGFCYRHNDYVDRMATYALNAIEVQPGKQYFENVEFQSHYNTT